jgi:hypothetical protein
LEELTRNAAIIAGLVVAIVSLVGPVPAAAQPPPPFLTTGLVPSGMKFDCTTAFPGFSINYTSTYTSSFTAIVIADLINTTGQTVAIGAGELNLSAHQQGEQFIPFVSDIATNYTAVAFATSLSGVPVSVTSTAVFMC